MLNNKIVINTKTKQFGIVKNDTGERLDIKWYGGKYKKSSCYKKDSKHIIIINNLKEFEDLQWAVQLKYEEVEEALQFLEDNTNLLWVTKKKPTHKIQSVLQYKYKYKLLSNNFGKTKGLTYSSNYSIEWNSCSYQINSFQTLKTIINALQKESTENVRGIEITKNFLFSIEGYKSTSIRYTGNSVKFDKRRIEITGTKITRKS